LKILFQQIRRFALVGVLATVLHVAVAMVCVTKIALNPLVANFFGFTVATLWSFFANWAWTFEKKTAVGNSAHKFLILSLCCFLLSELIVFVAVSQMNLPMWAAMLPVVVLVPSLSFVGSKFHVFKQH
jgi:putative flippase GtrA